MSNPHVVYSIIIIILRRVSHVLSIVIVKNPVRLRFQFNYTTDVVVVIVLGIF